MPAITSTYLQRKLNMPQQLIEDIDGISRDFLSQEGVVPNPEDPKSVSSYISALENKKIEITKGYSEHAARNPAMFQESYNWFVPRTTEVADLISLPETQQPEPTVGLRETKEPQLQTGQPLQAERLQAEQPEQRGFSEKDISDVLADTSTADLFKGPSEKTTQLFQELDQARNKPREEDIKISLSDINLYGLQGAIEKSKQLGGPVTAIESGLASTEKPGRGTGQVKQEMPKIPERPSETISLADIGAFGLGGAREISKQLGGPVSAIESGLARPRKVEPQAVVETGELEAGHIPPSDMVQRTEREYERSNKMEQDIEQKIAELPKEQQVEASSIWQRLRKFFAPTFEERIGDEIPQGVMGG